VIGEVLEKYEVLEKIGEGGMATVYRGRHTTLDRTVAVKVLHPHLTSSEKNRVRFAREARAIESLRHPNILRIFDYSGPESEKCFIVTEFIRGPTLRELLEDVGAMMAEPAALVALGLCRALRTAHSKKIIHRDLKPENIMLTADGRVKLMDFGIARLADDSQVTMTGALVGSPAYMSPEQATSGDIDARSDIFTLGTVIYRMVTGALPFQGTNPSIVLKNIIDGLYDDPLERVPSLSPRLASVINRCLELDRDDRFTDASEVERELSSFLASIDIDVDQPGQWAISEYMRDADYYEGQLRLHLVSCLVERGREETEQGTTARALQTFNRVLALDSDNTDVIDIIESMRPALQAPRRPLQILLWLSPIVLLIATLLGLYLLQPSETPAPAQSALLQRLNLAPMAAVPHGEAPVLNEIRLNETRTPSVSPALPPDPTALEKRRLAAEKARSVRETPVSSPPETATPASIREAGIENSEPKAAPEAGEERELAMVGSGQLHIMSTEGFLEVIVDDTPRGLTPVQPFTLSAGSHSVRTVETQFTMAQKLEVIVRPDEKKTLRLEPRYKTSTVQLEGFPAGAVVHLDGQALGEVRTIRLNRNRTFAIDVFSGGELLQTASVVRGVERGQLLPGRSLTIRYSGPREPKEPESP